MINHYDVLGVSAQSEPEVIRAAFRALMLKYHPDTTANADQGARAQRIVEAYRVLSNADLRAHYDAQRAHENRSPPPPHAAPPPPPPPPTTPPSINPRGFGVDPHKASSAKLGWSWRSTLGIIVCLGVVRMGMSAMSVEGATSGNEPNSIMMGDVDDANTLTDNSMMMSNDMMADDMMVGGGIMSGSMAEGDPTIASNGDLMASVTNTIAPIIPTTTYLGTPPPLDYEELEASVASFARVLNKSGMQGARRYSNACHQAVKAQPTWSKADGCAAFDLAAHYMDRAVNSASGSSTNGYFDFQAANQADHYGALFYSTTQVSQRLSRIRAAVEPITGDAVVSGVRGSTPAPRVTPEAARRMDRIGNILDKADTP